MNSRFQPVTNAMVERLARALPSRKRSFRSTAWDAAELRPAARHADDCRLAPGLDRLYLPTGKVGVSPWVNRCVMNDLPTFGTHSGAYAYRPRKEA